jgi:PEP-CTERM motif
MTITRLASLFALGLITAAAHAQVPLFSENFGTNTDGTAITTSNTAFTYARISTGATPILAFKNPSSFGAGASAQLLATTASLSGLGVTSGTYTAFDVATLSFDLRTPTAFSTGSSFFFGAGTGATTFTNNSTFSTADLMGGFQVTTGGILQSRSAGAWNTVSGVTLTSATNYSFSVVMNGSASAVNYGSGGAVAPARADIYLNNVLVGDDIAIQDGASVTAFRMYVISQAAANGGYELDTVRLFDSAVMPGGGVIPEPGTFALATLGLAGLALYRRRQK